MKDGLGFSLLPGNRPSTVNSASGFATLGWSFGASTPWDQSNSHCSTKVYAGALRLHRKDCFRAQTLSIAATNRQRSPEIVATATVGEVTAMKAQRTADS